MREIHDFLFEKAVEGMTAEEILNYYRNLYHAEPQSTEHGIVANALNDILPRMIVPPCKVGDTVYYINTFYFSPLERNKVYRAEVTRIVITKRAVSFVAKVRYANNIIEITEDGFGENVFLTREEAEQALKGEQT